MARKDKPLDSTMQVVTPENIAFEYQLAGPFRRLPALSLDFFFVITILIIITKSSLRRIALLSPYIFCGTFPKCEIMLIYE